MHNHHACLIAHAGPLSPDVTLGLQFVYIPSALLSCAGAALPGLRSLKIFTSGRLEFPHPRHLPALRELVLGYADTIEEAAAMWQSVAPYLRQLESLTIDETDWNVNVRPVWAQHIFTAATTSTTLKHLTLAYPLLPWLCGPLQQHAPVSRVWCRLCRTSYPHCHT